MNIAKKITAALVWSVAAPLSLFLSDSAARALFARVEGFENGLSA
jgi:hypothetical protein